MWQNQTIILFQKWSNKKRNDKKKSIKINFMTFEQYLKQKDWKYKDICKYHSAENTSQFNVIRGVPRNMRVARRFKGCLWSLK